MADNIETVVDEKVEKRERRLAENRRRAAEWREDKRRAQAPTPAAVAEALVLCLLDIQTLPPSMRENRGETIQQVLRQAHRTLTALGHPEVGQSMVALVESLRERLRTETWHHPLRHTLSRKTPSNTPVTLTAPVAYPADRIADRTRNTDAERVA